MAGGRSQHNLGSQVNTVGRLAKPGHVGITGIPFTTISSGRGTHEPWSLTTLGGSASASQSSVETLGPAAGVALGDAPLKASGGTGIAWLPVLAAAVVGWFVFGRK